MTTSLRRRRRALATRRALQALALSVGVLLLPACSRGVDTLLKARDPDLIDPADLATPSGALAMYAGAMDRFRDMTAGQNANGQEGMWMFGGLLADEWSTSSTFTELDEIDKRNIQTSNESVTDSYRFINRVRTASNQAIAAYAQFHPTRTAEIGELHFARGFAELQLAQDFCNGIPLSDAAGSEVVYGEPLMVAEVFERAVASFDEALAAVGTAQDAASVGIRRAASIGKGRALLGLGRYAEAAAAVAGVPTSYTYDHTFLEASGSNAIWGQATSGMRHAVGDSLEGNDRSIRVFNVVPFFSADDPRVPADYVLSSGVPSLGQDGQTFAKVTTLWGRTTPVSVVNGIDARLIEAEAALQAGDAPRMLQILAALRASPQTLGAITTPAMPALPDPGSEAGRVSLLFRERAFWTFSRGQRLGDLRRLVRQYGRAPESVYPEGTHYKGGTYGDDLNFPVPQEEENNPSFTGCIDRNA